MAKRPVIVGEGERKNQVKGWPETLSNLVTGFRARKAARLDLNSPTWPAVVKEKGERKASQFLGLK
ncbi:hypothetical protein TIFTF001_031445 [Ficus carica]|uniref:Uncharacterized protein n=1 Tax=Ficus carica TaxID=3494 RepID=A0AA88J562_FICCA|nr:hypothetical protein TIFTF001_031445 [Ficus carica]